MPLHGNNRQKKIFWNSNTKNYRPIPNKVFRTNRFLILYQFKNAWS